MDVGALNTHPSRFAIRDLIFCLRKFQNACYYYTKCIRYSFNGFCKCARTMVSSWDESVFVIDDYSPFSFCFVFVSRCLLRKKKKNTKNRSRGDRWTLFLTYLIYIYIRLCFFIDPLFSSNFAESLSFSLYRNSAIQFVRSYFVFARAINHQ